jgi:hypothetical protein
MKIAAAAEANQQMKSASNRAVAVAAASGKEAWQVMPMPLLV